MSKLRRIKLSDKKRKKGFCSWCDIAVVKPRIYWCSNECVTSYRLQADPAFLRSRVFERDQGVCALCGLDTEALKRAYNEALRASCKGVEDKMLALGFKITNKSMYGSFTLWENDHTIPVVEGGGAQWDKDDDIVGRCRSLCRPCHRKVTRELAERRKKKP